MMHFFDLILTWYSHHLNYNAILLLMAIESSFLPLPSELVIPPAAYLAFKGGLNLWMIIIFATIGCIIGALFNYTISYILGRRIIYGLADTKLARVIFVTPEKIKKAEDYFLENGSTSTLIGRLVPVIRHLISIPAGLAKMNIGHFVTFTAIGSLVWNTTLALLSYFLIDNWKVYFKEITIGFILIGVLFIVYLIYKAIKNKKISIS